MGLIGLLVLALIGVAVGRVLARIMLAHRQPETRAKRHPRLDSCPNCQISLALDDDSCPQCGLRISR